MLSSEDLKKRQFMTFYGFLGIVIFVAVFLAVAISIRLYQRCRCDAGYNIGRNHMYELGFDDDDIENGQDDADADLYVFRKKKTCGKCDQ